MFSINFNKTGANITLHKGFMKKLSEIETAMESLQAFLPEAADVQKAIEIFLDKYATEEHKIDAIAARDPNADQDVS